MSEWQRKANVAAPPVCGPVVEPVFVEAVLFIPKRVHVCTFSSSEKTKCLNWSSPPTGEQSLRPQMM